MKRSRVYNHRPVLLCDIAADTANDELRDDANECSNSILLRTFCHYAGAEFHSAGSVR